MINKKGASEIIVTMLIVVVVVILATILFAWFKSSSQNKLDETTDELKQVSDLKCMNASFIIESCIIDTNNFFILFSNNSDIRLFNLVLSIHGKNNDEDILIVGRFNDIIQPGEMKNLKTNSNFIFLTGDNNTLSTINTIDNIILTNAACPNKILNLNCEYK